MVKRIANRPGWGFAAGLAIVVGFLYLVRQILLPFVMAAALAYLASPLMRWLEKRLGWPRWAAASLAYAAVIGIVGGLGYLIAELLASELLAASKQAPDVVHGLVAQLIGRRQIVILGKTIDSDLLAERALLELQDLITSARGAEQLASLGIGVLVGTVLTLILTLYFLLAHERLAQGMLWLVPPSRRPEIRRLARGVAPVLARYVRGVFLVVLYTSVAAWLGYGLVFHLGQAVLLSLAVGFLELIPVIGPIAAAALVGMAAIQQESLMATAAVMAWAIALRLSIDQLVGPLVLGRAVTLHPVVIMFAFLAGGILLGVLGVLLAVPIAAAIKLALAQYYGEPAD